MESNSVRVVPGKRFLRRTSSIWGCCVSSLEECGWALRKYNAVLLAGREVGEEVAGGCQLPFGTRVRAIACQNRYVRSDIMSSYT